MEALPAEVLHQICSYLQSDYRDVTSYRLVCKLFAAVGIEYLLPIVYVAYDPQSLARLKEISEHPVIRQHVRTVCYLTNTVPVFHDFEKWKELAVNFDTIDWKIGYITLYHPPVHPCTETPISDSRLENGWKDFQRFKARQDKLWNTDNDGHTFIRSLASFPSLCGVEMYDSAARGFRRKNGNLFRHHPFEETLVPFHYYSNIRRSFGIGQFFTLLSAMKLCQSTLRSLEMTELTWRVFKTLPPVAELQKALSCLRHLHMLVRTHSLENSDENEHDDGESDECEELISTGCIGRFVASAPNLETIELTFDMDDWNSVHCIYHLPDVIGDQTYPNLRRLALGGVEISEDSFGTFLQRHADTLRDLELRDSRLTFPSMWFNIFTKIPKILDLEEVLLDGFFVISEGGTSDKCLDMDLKIMNADLCVGRVLEMIVCRNFTRKYGHPCANEEEIRSQVLSDIVRSQPGNPSIFYDEGLRVRKIRNTYLMCQLYEKKKDLRLAKLAKAAGYPDPLRYEAQFLWKRGTVR